MSFYPSVLQHIFPKNENYILQPQLSKSIYLTLNQCRHLTVHLTKSVHKFLKLSEYCSLMLFCFSSLGGSLESLIAFA